MKKAFITGVTGQDGSYLAEILLEKGYEVHAGVRRVSNPNLGRIKHLTEKIHLHDYDLTDLSSCIRILALVRPDEIYNLAAMSHVRLSFDSPIATGNITGIGAVNMLEAYRQVIPAARFYQASSSEMFGGVEDNRSATGYTEDSPFYPRSPYGAAKLYAHWMARNYRESYGLHISCGILFNHESERRGEMFVTRKITRALTRIFAGLQTKLYLGNLTAKRDWGHAKDYMEAAWLMLQQPTGGDYVVATGETYSVQEFLEEASSVLGLPLDGIVEILPSLYRPAEVDILLGDPSKAKRVLGWEPKIKFKDLVRRMVESDLILTKYDAS